MEQIEHMKHFEHFEQIEHLEHLEHFELRAVNMSFQINKLYIINLSKTKRIKNKTSFIANSTQTIGY